jgi:hypothetical protein
MLRISRLIAIVISIMSAFGFSGLRALLIPATKAGALERPGIAGASPVNCSYPIPGANSPSTYPFWPSPDQLERSVGPTTECGTRPSDYLYLDGMHPVDTDYIRCNATPIPNDPRGPASLVLRQVTQEYPAEGGWTFGPYPALNTCPNSVDPGPTVVMTFWGDPGKCYIADFVVYPVAAPQKTFEIAGAARPFKAITTNSSTMHLVSLVKPVQRPPYAAQLTLLVHLSSPTESARFNSVRIWELR